MGEAVIVSACRTAVGDAGRSPLGAVPIHELGRVVVAEALKRSGVAADDVDDVVLGEVMHGGGAVSRYVAVDLGLTHIPGMAVTRHCATGIQGLVSAAADIRAGMTSAAIAGGVENMTRTPATHQRTPEGLVPWVSLTHPEDPQAPPMEMGITVGENTADECGITRAEQDAWALRSHQRATAAIDAGRFAEEIVPVECHLPGGQTVVFDTDSRPRRDTSLEKLAALPPAFREGGTVTAGNSSGISDGAAAVVVVDEAFAEARGLEPLAIVRGWGAVGVEPRRTGLAPTLAVPKVLGRLGLTLDDIDLIELNEAFASMSVACTRLLELDPDIVNVNGGAVALGHPVAATGAKLAVTLIHELRRRGGGLGLVTMCAGGGMGHATVLEVL